MIPDRLRAALDAMRGRKVVVLGDLMLDEYVWGDVRRISPDAPVQVVDVRRRSRAIGGAANVASNLAAAGAAVRLVGVSAAGIVGDTPEQLALFAPATGLRRAALNRALDAIVARFGLESVGRGGTGRSEKGLTTRLKRGE